MSEVKTLAAFVRRAKGEMQCRYPAVDDEMCSVALDAVDEFEQEIGKLLPLDSPVLPLSCPTCGGSGTARAEMLVGVATLASDVPCPTCHGARRFVVLDAKAWEAFVCRMAPELPQSVTTRAGLEAFADAHDIHAEAWWVALESLAQDAATALLGEGWRVAREVQNVVVPGDCNPARVPIIEVPTVLLGDGPDRTYSVAILEPLTPLPEGGGDE